MTSWLLRSFSVVLLAFAGLLVVGAATGFTANSTTNSTAALAAGAPVLLIDIAEPIGPATSDHVIRGIAEALQSGAAAVVLRLDTPGGLDTSMREIVQAILASPVPIIAFVAPAGARAASAGTYIVYASHVAAMAPGTNVGAATPVRIGAPTPLGGEPEPAGPSGDAPPDARAGSEDHRSHPGMAEKALNDAAAYLRGLAQLRGRNVEWADKAVREAASLPAEEALRQNVIDVIAPDVPPLLTAIDGRRIVIDGRSVSLATAGAQVVAIPADWRTRLLSLIADPNVASLLMLIGIYALIFEFYTPGLMGPGVFGAICILLAFYAFRVLPIDWTGVALLLLGIALMGSEVLIGAFGVLGLAGVVAFVLGFVMLVPHEAPGFAVAWGLIGPVAAVLTALFLAVMVLVMRARQRPAACGMEAMPGRHGQVLDWRNKDGVVRVRGEIWSARARSTLNRGQSVRITAIDGLVLDVEPDEAERRDR